MTQPWADTILRETSKLFAAIFLRWTRSTLAECTGVYDRAALIALPPDMRERYVQHVYAQLSDRYRGLLLTLDYRQEQMDGPPFSVHDAEVLSLYSGHSDVEIIDRRDILAKEPKFAEKGLTQLDTVVYRLSSGSRKSTV